MLALLISTVVAVGGEAKIGGTIENTMRSRELVECNKAKWKTHLRRADFVKKDKDNGLNEPREHEVFLLLTEHEPCA
jgi:hypothetical protein